MPFSVRKVVTSHPLILENAIAFSNYSSFLETWQALLEKLGGIDGE
jgi:hypothetical protein